jgi:hypothetical protein
MTLHPDFERHPRHRWAGPLPELRRALDREATDRPGWWVWRVLPHGACVALRRGEGVREVRISRSDRPAEGAAAKWAKELAVFERELDLTRWTREHEGAAQGVAALYRIDERRVCPCGRTIDENAQLWGDGEHCEICIRGGQGVR